MRTSNNARRLSSPPITSLEFVASSPVTPSRHPSLGEFIKAITFTNFFGIIVFLAIIDIETWTTNRGVTTTFSTMTRALMVPTINLLIGIARAYYKKHYYYCKREYTDDPPPEEELITRLNYGGAHITLTTAHILAELKVSDALTTFWQNGGVPVAAAVGFSLGETIYCYRNKHVDYLPSMSAIFLPAGLFMFAIITYNNFFRQPIYSSDHGADFIIPLLALLVAFTLTHMIKTHMVAQYITHDFCFDFRLETNEAWRFLLVGGYVALCLGQACANQQPNNSLATIVWKDGGYLVGTLAGAGAGLFARTLTRCLQREETGAYTPLPSTTV